MLILAFDTTSPDGSISLWRDGEELGTENCQGQGNYSVALFEMAERLLTRAGLSLAEIDLFAAATGPGSFTGIRVGLAAAQGWAGAFGRPVLGVSVLEAMVEAARPGAGVAAPLLDARRGEFYLGVFRRQANDGSEDEPGFALTGEGMVLGPERIAALAGELGQGGSEVEFIARENDQLAAELVRQLPCKWSTVESFLASALARVALRQARRGRLQRPADLDALYIRRSDAEMNWRE